jgi:alkyl hydroperoxide reductase subunit F
MLDQNLKDQLADYLERVREPFEIVATLGSDTSSQEMRTLLEQIALLSDKITVNTQEVSDDTDVRVPSFALQRKTGAPMKLRFAAIPLGHEFTSLVLALLWTGGHPPKVEDDTLAQIRALQFDAPQKFDVFMSLSCHNCPDVVQALSLMAINNPAFDVTIIDGGLNQKEVEDKGIMAVPALHLDGKMFHSGRASLEEIVAKLDTGAAKREAAKLSAKAPYDVLILGGGPAGAAAAVYAARKGIRTGLLAERFGGQVNDTMAIENYIGVPETDGPKYAAALEQHVKTYDVDFMNGHRAASVMPADSEGGYITLKTESGGELKTRNLIIATGARWRNMNVPGEQEYKNKGVAYCPHCDGPLFKGKDVAVIGGGNSGVEAAIDLAGLVKHVTVFEFMPEMKADAVLVNKLKSLPNVTIHLNTQTLEVTGSGEGAGARMNGLRFKDRATNVEQTLAVEGVFVQIGLVPNTEFLGTTIERTKFGEIVIDAKNHTNVAGIFGAGDCTTVPYKQIVIAASEGAKAALSAFDHLIRTPAPQVVRETAAV